MLSRGLSSLPGEGRESGQAAMEMGNYSFSKTLQQVRMLNAQDLNLSNPGATKLVKEPADQLDIPQKFVTSALYELPWGPGKRFLAGRGIAGQVFGGWKVNGIVTLLPRMLKHGEGGHIVNTSSMSGLVPHGGATIYVTSKGAVHTPKVRPSPMMRCATNRMPSGNCVALAVVYSPRAY